MTGLERGTELLDLRDDRDALVRRPEQDGTRPRRSRRRSSTAGAGPGVARHGQHGRDVERRAGPHVEERAQRFVVGVAAVHASCGSSSACTAPTRSRAIGPVGGEPQGEQHRTGELQGDVHRVTVGGCGARGAWHSDRPVAGRSRAARRLGSSHDRRARPAGRDDPPGDDDDPRRGVVDGPRGRTVGRAGPQRCGQDDAAAGRVRSHAPHERVCGTAGRAAGPGRRLRAASAHRPVERGAGGPDPVRRDACATSC